MTRRLLLPSLVWLATLAQAVPVEKWVQTTQADFQQGQAKGVSISSLGQLALAPDITPLLPSPVPHVWALAIDAKGAVYAATGTEPKLLRISGGKAETIFTSPVKTDLEVLALAIGPDGALYASTAPSGTLWRIGPDGKAEAFYKHDEPYIWAIAAGSDGTLYAATGPNGRLLKITPKGKPTTLLTAGARHLLCLLLAPDGSLYAGSDKDGLLYHVSPRGEARLAYDADESDIRALTLDRQGRLLFATAGPVRSAPTTPSPAPPSPTPATGRMPGTSGPDGGHESGGAPGITITRSMPGAPTTAPERPGAANSIYRLMPGGDVVKLGSVAGAAFYALLWHNDKLYAGTGNDGKLYCIEGNRLAQLANLDDAQITALALAQGRIVLATANSGRVYQLAADHAPSGTFTSRVHDSGAHSRWGMLTWAASIPPGAAATIATRSGNSATPDDTWSPWSNELSRADGDQVPSPPARFIQWRLTLKASRAGASPTLDEVALAYAQSNRRPTIAQLQVAKVPKPRRPPTMPPPGQMPMQQPMPSPTQPRADQPPPSPRGPFADLIRISWQATDPNKDDLVYALYFKGEDETTWKRLNDRVTSTFYDWDTHAVPDGLYRIRLVARDAPTNPPGEALESERITPAFIVDNTPPAVTGLAARVAKDRSVTITAKCSDATTGLAAGEYAVDGGDWVAIAPVDGLFDGQAEALDFKLPPLEKGERTIVVRVRDHADNTGAAKAVLTIE